MDRTENRQRLRWVDYAKTIAIFLVILAHIHFRIQFLTDFICSFVIPLFFFISGYLNMPKTSFIDRIKRDFRRLMIPYFAFYVLTYFVWLEGFIRHPELFPDRTPYAYLIKPFIGMLLGVGYDTRFSYMVNVPLWFLPALFFGKMIFAGLKTVFKGRDILIFSTIVMLAAALAALKTFHIVPIFSIGSALMALPFYYLGYQLRISGFDIHRIPLYSVVPAFAAAAAATFFLVSINGYVDVNYVNFGRSPIIFYAAAITGLIISLSVSLMLDEYSSRVVTYISDNTLTIFAVHETILFFIQGLIGRFLPSEPFHALHSVTYGILVSASVLALCTIPVAIINRYLPFMTGKAAAPAIRGWG